MKAAYRLVASNLRLVVKLAHEYHRNPLRCWTWCRRATSG